MAAPRRRSRATCASRICADSASCSVISMTMPDRSRGSARHTCSCSSAPGLTFTERYRPAGRGVLSAARRARASSAGPSPPAQAAANVSKGPLSVSGKRASASYPATVPVASARMGWYSMCSRVCAAAVPGPWPSATWCAAVLISTPESSRAAFTSPLRRVRRDRYRQISAQAVKRPPPAAAGSGPRSRQSWLHATIATVGGRHPSF
jgi:hypothetical protein